MPSAVDLALVQRDPQLPGLAIALDPAAIQEILQPYLPNAEWEISDCLYVRYKPSTNCVATYKIRFQNQWIDVYVKALRSDNLDKLQKWAERPATPDVLGLSRIVLKEQALMIGTFWNDTKLTQLAKIACNELPLRLQLWPEVTAEAGEWQSLRYKPERRYVARWQGQTQSGENPSILAKLYTPVGYAKALLAAQAFQSQGKLRVPKVVHLQPSKFALGFEWLQGRLLQELMDQEQREISGEMPLNQLLQRVGEALALLHKQQASQLLAFSRTQEIEQLLNTAELLSQLFPAITEIANTIVDQGITYLAQLPLYSVPIHGDFYAEQVVIMAQQIGIVDLDCAVQGDPATDLGNFLARLEYQTILNPTVDPMLQRAKIHLLDGYGATTNLEQRMQAYTAINLFKLAPMLFRYRHPDWPNQLRQLLERVKALGSGVWNDLPERRSGEGL
jgi:thiamine kinase-like enzyme